MDQQQPIATHFCRLGCQLVLDIFTELYKLDILHYITLHIIAVSLRSWRLGATMEVYLTENRTVCGRPTCRLSGRRGVRWELYCFAPRVLKILVMSLTSVDVLYILRQTTTAAEIYRKRRTVRLDARQETQLSPRDHAMRRVSRNLANCHATVQKLLVRQVLNQVSAVAN